jgi:hypothetical protein
MCRSPRTLGIRSRSRPASVDAQDLPDRRESITAEPVERLVQELRAHEFELELQNEQLRLAQAELTASRERYMDLYDFAPVGYFTLDRLGSISGSQSYRGQAPGCGAKHLGGRSFRTLCCPRGPRPLSFHCSQVGSAGGVPETEIRLIRGRVLSSARLEGRARGTPRDPATGA